MMTLAEDVAEEPAGIAGLVGVAPFLASEIIEHAKVQELRLYALTPHEASAYWCHAAELAHEAFLDWVDAQS